MKVTFIGLGIMGSRMAANLLKNGVDVTVWNRSKASVKALEAQGAKSVSTANEAVKDADIVFSMLSNPEVVEQIFLIENGVLSAMKKGAIWVDCSTVNPSFSLKSNEVAKANDIIFIDAPVAGTLPQAQNADLVFFVGAEKNVLEKIETYLNFMGKKVINIGEIGKGASFKMLVNIMLAQSMVIFSEAVLLGEKMGISQDFLLNVIPNLAVTAPFTQFKTDMIKSDNYPVNFPLELMQKDLHLAAITAYELQQPLHLANITKELFAAANQKGMGRLDFAAIHQFLENR